MKLFRRKVQQGQELGRRIGFPTVNLRVGNFGDHVKQGVYGCRVWHNGEQYQGLLHFGPKMGQRKRALEIYIHRFNKMIYGEWIAFTVGKKIRDVQKIGNLNELKKMITQDLQALKN